MPKLPREVQYYSLTSFATQKILQRQGERKRIEGEGDDERRESSKEK